MIRTALIQQPLAESYEHTLVAAEAHIREAARSGARLIAFPELAFLPFFPQHRLTGDRFAYSESIPGPTTERFCALARELGVVLVLNMFERDGDRAYDSSPVIDADGKLLGVARMMHITHYEGFWEQDYYDPSPTGPQVFETAVGRVGVAICYDRHYPEYMRELALLGADMVIIPQAGAEGEWPGGVYQAEVQVASFQNGFFCALCNRVGQEDVLTFSGESFATSPTGQIIAEAPSGEPGILYADCDLSQVGASPARTLFLNHRRPDMYHSLAETHGQ